MIGFSSPAFCAETGSVCFKNFCVQPEIARTQAEKEHGLMARVRLMSGQGMLFVYNDERRPDFWMKNMLMPLDFIWISAEKRVVDISQNIPPCKQDDCPTIRSRAPVQYVLEVAAGTIEKNGIKMGDQAVIREKEGHEK